MKLTQGLYDRMVLQRTRSDQCDARFEGTTTATGTLVARVSQKGEALDGFKGGKVGKAAKRRFEGRLRGIPTGGPYNIELSIIDRSGKAIETTVLSDVLVGDVWALAGQSNMQGVGLLADAIPGHKMVRAYYMNDRWDVAADPLHQLGLSIDEVHCGPDGPLAATPIPAVSGVGPGVAFGQSMHERTGVPQGLLATAHGGTSMTQWNPALRSKGGKSLYGSMLRCVRCNGGRVAGVVWYQGESDSNSDAHELYTSRMKKLAAAMRKDFQSAKMPIVAVQIGRVMSTERQWPAWNSIQNQQYQLPHHIEKLAVVPSIDLQLDDNIHISGADQQRLGKRCAQAMCHLLGKAYCGSKELPPIEVKSAKLIKEPREGFSSAEITFKNVVGSLSAGDCRPMGFNIGELSNSNAIFKTEVKGNKVIISSTLSPVSLNSASVCYGMGLNPPCNITDELDRSLPVFLNFALGKPKAVTPYVTKLRWSGWQDAAGSTTKPAYPDADTLRKMQPLESTEAFVAVHTYYDKSSAADPVVYFACAFECATKMKLDAMLGYDGPIRIWVDRKQIFADPAGTNPAIIDAKRASFEATKGRHELVIGLGSNNRKAWGFMLRFERKGVAQKTIDAGKAVVPQWIE